MNEHYRLGKKYTKKLKKQKHPQKMLVNQAINEITAGMKETMPKYKRIYTSDGNYILVNLHDMLA